MIFAKTKNIKKVSTRHPDIVRTSSIDHQKNLKEDKGQDQTMNNIIMYHKTILDYAKHLHKNDAIDNCRYNHNNMVGEDFTDSIKRDLPILHNVLNPISRMHLIHKLQNLTMNAQIQGWEEFCKKTGERNSGIWRKQLFSIRSSRILHAWK